MNNKTSDEKEHDFSDSNVSKILKNDLIKHLWKKSVRLSDKPEFKLASGKMSNFYINCKPTILDPEGMFLVGTLVFEMITEPNIKAIGGMTFGADPISIAASFVSWLRKKPVNAFSVRKTQKDHGMIRWIEGDLSKSDRVVVVDDVVTTGRSTLDAIERCKSEGLEVAQVIVLADRQEGGLEEIRKVVPFVNAIVTKEELLNYGQNNILPEIN